MITVGLLGATVGLGLVGLVLTARRRGLRLADALGVVEGDPVPVPSGRTRLRPDRALGASLAGVARDTKIGHRLEADLFVTERTLEGLCAESVLAGGAGLVLPVGASVVMAVGGVHLPLAMTALVAVIMAAAGVVLPVVALTHEGRRERLASRRSLGSFLDLVVLCLASGMGLEGALEAAAGITEQRLVRRLRRALAVARGAGRAPWTALEDIGRRGELEELQELAAALGLAGREGARIRVTLAAKAASLRRRELAAAESAANRATERLFLPGVLLLLGFLVFIGYPAMARIAVGL